MAMDPSLSLQIQAPQFANPFQLAMQASQMRAQQEQVRSLAEQRAASADEHRMKMAAFQEDRAQGDALRQLQAWTPETVYPIIGPEKGAKILQGQAALQEQNLKTDTAVRGAIGAVLGGIKALPDDLREAAFTGAVKHFADRGVLDPAQVEPYSPAVLDRYLRQAQTANEQVTTGETHANNAVLRQQADKALQQTIARDAASSAARIAADTETARHNRQTESQSATTSAREQAKFDRTYGAGVAEDGKSLPADPLAKAIAEYRMPPPSSRALATGPGMALMQRVEALNPSFDGAQFPARQKMRVAFTSGPQSQTLNSLNTAIEHLDQFAGFAQAMGNGNFQPTNELKNWLKTQFGDSAPTNFEGIRTVLSGEVASALKKSGATDIEIANVEKSMRSKSSPGQLFDYATKVIIPALGSKAHTFDAQWKQAMGDKDPYSVYTPGAKAVLDKYAPTAAPAAEQRPIPGVPGGVAEKRDGKWIRVK